MQTTLIVALYFAVQAVGLCLVPFGLPGLWLQVAAAVVLAAVTMLLGWGWVALFVALALAGEGIEFLSGRWGARRFGGSARAGWGALLGGIVGAVVGGIPVPVIGSILMSFAGTFVGAVLGEMSARGALAPEIRVGLGAVIGRAIGIGAKMGVGLAIVLGSLLGIGQRW